AVQLLLQSPPLVKALRERQYFKKKKYVTKKENDPEQDMWACFVELAQQAIQPNAQKASFNPTYIATQLRKRYKGFKYEKGEMNDALAAFVDIAQLLDKNFLKRMGAHIKDNEDDWQTIGLKGADLEKKITDFYEAYNPKHVSSPIRKMHFILEESYEAVGLLEEHKHAEKWYKEKTTIFLPWEDFGMDIKVDFYENNKKKNETFKLNLKKTSSVQSLQYMIFDQLMERNADYKKYTAEDIKIGYVNIKDIKYPAVDFSMDDFSDKKKYIFAHLESENNLHIKINNAAINEKRLSGNKTQINVDFYASDGTKKTETFNLSGKTTVRSLQKMIFDELKQGEKAEDIKIGYVYITDIKYPFEGFTIEELLKKQRYIFAQLTTQKPQKQPNVATIQVDHTAINKAKKPATITNVEEGIDLYLRDYVDDESFMLLKKKYKKGSKVLVRTNIKVPVKHIRKKIVKYPDVLILSVERNESPHDDYIKDPIDFEEKMTLDGNNYYLAGVIYYSGLHFWSHVKSIDDGQWYEANDRKITKIGKEIMPFVRGEKTIGGL
ncbi:MAG: ubiquitin carboxyl-terminal hydrolase family protein, partial [Bacteroidota bacterium]